MKKTIPTSFIFLALVFSFQKSTAKHCHAEFSIGGTIYPAIFTTPSVSIDTLFNAGDLINISISVSSGDYNSACSCSSDSVWWLHNGVLVSSSLSYTVTDTGVYNIYDNVDVAQNCLGVYNFQLTLHVGYRIPTSVNEVSNTNTFRIFPNPAKGAFSIANISSDKISLLQIINPVGEIVYAETLYRKSDEIIDANLAKGIYFVRLQNNEGNFVRKLVVE